MNSGSEAPGASLGTTHASEPPQTPPTATPRPGTRRHVLALGIAVIAVAVLAVVAVLATTRPAARFAPDSPEAAFQAYLTAWDAHDLDAAYATFSDRVRQGLAIDEYRRAARDFSYGSGDTAERRVVLLRTDARDNAATLDLRVDHLGNGGMFGAGSVWSQELSIALVREHETWRLDQALANLEPLAWYGK